ncbi:MAG TPA: nucleotidyltransferase domain-containing protein [Phycisphaerae bacterium]|jgi:predicted nucleotidyltransferase|nr:nucleotidyltransferase domain-containing protein [Phycisphaerae bacterium]
MVVDEKTIEEAVRMLLGAAPPGSKAILFGSYARGEPKPDSDLDVVVVEPQVKDRFAEMVRLREVLRSFQMAVDVLVVSAKVFEEWRDTPNTVIYEAAREGKVYEQVA